MFSYTNKGSGADTGHLYIKLKDDQGNLYNSTDVTMNLIEQGQTSEMRFLEVPMQKDRKVAGFEIIEGFNVTYYPIEYQTLATTTPTQDIPVISGLPISKACCCAPLLLPLLVLGVVFVGRKKR